MDSERHTEEPLHPVHILITIGAIAAGALLAFGYTGTVSGVGPPCPYTCQNSTHTKAGQTTSCTPDLPTVQRYHKDYVKYKNAKDPEGKAKFEKAKAALMQCADDNLNNCAGMTSGSGPSRNACDKDPGKGLPKTDDKKKEEPKKDEGGKPPEMPKPPEGKKDEPKKDEPKDKMQECLAQGKTQEQCNKELNQPSSFSDTLKNAWQTATDWITGGETPKTDAEDLLNETAKTETPAPDPQGTPKNPTPTTPAPTNPEKTGTTEKSNPLEQQKPPQSGPFKASSFGGAPTNTGFGDPKYDKYLNGFKPTAQNPKPLSQQNWNTLTPTAQNGIIAAQSPTQTTVNTVQAAVTALRDLLYRYFGFKY